jgi:hypothetical protein
MTTDNTDHQSFQDEAKRETSLLVAISRAIEASPVKHQGTREEAVRAILGKLQASHTLRVGDRGWVAAFTHDGQHPDFAKLVTDAMLLDKSIGDTASIAAAVKAGTIELGSKNELTTPAQKVEFVKKFGLAAWEKLPAHRVAPVGRFDDLTAAQLKTLPLSVKVKLTETQISNALKRK